MTFDPTKVSPGGVVYNLAGTRMRFIAFVPQAKPEQRVVCLHDGDIVLYNQEGQFFGPHRPSKMDLTHNRP